MSDLARQEKQSLWREGLRLFRVHWREWSKLAVGFFIVIAVLSVGLNHVIADPAFKDVLNKFHEANKAKQQLGPADHEMLMSFIWRCAVLGVLYLTLILIQVFAFTEFFMSRQPGVGKPELGLRRFFFWLWICFLLGLVMTAFMVVTFGVGWTLHAFLPQLHPALTFLGFAIPFGFFLYCAVRLYPSMTLAVCDTKPIFRTSWDITRGNFWRLLGNSLLFVLIIFFLVFVMAMVGAVITVTMTYELSGSIAPAQPPAAVLYFQAVFNAFFITVAGGMIRAFACAATGILYREKYPDGLPAG